MGDSVALPQLEAQLAGVLTCLWETVDVYGTSERVVRMWAEMTIGYQQDPGDILSRQFEEPGTDELIVCSNIPFTSLCEHHLLPFYGTATVGYLPSNGRVVGLSKLARLVDCFALRLQLQERLTRQIADAMRDNLDPLAVGVVIAAEHACLACRGARKPGTKFITSAMQGLLRTEGKLRAEFFAMIQNA